MPQNSVWRSIQHDRFTSFRPWILACWRSFGSLLRVKMQLRFLIKILPRKAQIDDRPEALSQRFPERIPFPTPGYDPVLVGGQAWRNQMIGIHVLDAFVVSSCIVIDLGDGLAVGVDVTFDRGSVFKNWRIQNVCDSVACLCIDTPADQMRRVLEFRPPPILPSASGEEGTPRISDSMRIDQSRVLLRHRQVPQKYVHLCKRYLLLREHNLH